MLWSGTGWALGINLNAPGYEAVDVMVGTSCGTRTVILLTSSSLGIVLTIIMMHLALDP